MRLATETKMETKKMEVAIREGKIISEIAVACLDGLLARIVFRFSG